MLDQIAKAKLPPPLHVSGRVQARFALGHRGSRIADLFESGGFRVKFPHKTDETCEAILVNTGGGMTGGDALDVHISVDAGASALVASQSAEKIYRSSGSTAQICTNIELSEKSRFCWVPQETILFSGARVARELCVELPDSATFLAAESVVFGRSASGESLGDGYFSDRWRIRRGGRLVFAENTRLEGELSALLARTAIANGARATATMVLICPEAEERLEPARDALADVAATCALSAWNGMLVARLLSRDAQSLRAALGRLISHLRGAPMPRVWQC